MAFNSFITEPGYTSYWLPTLSLIKAKIIPLIITGYTYLEVADDIKILKKKVYGCAGGATSNPRRSLLPRPDLIKEGNNPFYHQISCFCNSYWNLNLAIIFLEYQPLKSPNFVFVGGGGRRDGTTDDPVASC